MTIETYLEGLGTTLEADAKTAFSSFFGSFVTTDLGKLTTDAVQYADTLVDADDETKRDAAKTQLLNDAQAAGKDLSTAGDAFLNFLIETALQAVMAGAVAGIAEAESKI